MACTFSCFPIFLNAINGNPNTPNSPDNPDNPDSPDNPANPLMFIGPPISGRTFIFHQNLINFLFNNETYFDHVKNMFQSLKIYQHYVLRKVTDNSDDKKTINYRLNENQNISTSRDLDQPVHVVWLITLDNPC